MSLQEKVLNLKLEAALAVKHAQGWQRLIDKYGEEKATAFYKHLGLNHLDQPSAARVHEFRIQSNDSHIVNVVAGKKSFEWEGLTLSREPKEHEKIAVKGIANAQESAKEQIGSVLLTLRSELIEDGLKGIKKLEPATYHELILQASSESRSDLRDRLIKVHRKGRLLVARELGGSLPKGLGHEAGCSEKFTKNDPPGYQCECEFKEANPADEFDDLDELVGVTLSRVVNETQSRIIASATEGVTLGLSGADLQNSIQSAINMGSVTYIDRAAGGLSNRVIGIGRRDEMRDREDDIERYEYSSLLDVNTCSSCAALDGTTAQSMDDLPEVPLVDCDGGSMCRCFLVAISL